MKIRNASILSALILTTTLFLSCSPEIQKETRRLTDDGKYDSEFPATPASPALNEISRSIFLINCVGSYRTYTFDEKERITAGRINDEFLEARLGNAGFSDNSVRGTTLVVYNDGIRIGFLTCAHVLVMPDTVLTYFRDANRRPTPFVRSAAVKIRQFNFISPMAREGSVEVLVCDTATDIAIVGRRVDDPVTSSIPKFRYPMGNASELGWGTFTYVLSCPAGVKMVTSALTSVYTRDPEESFFVDAVVGTGSSGGIVLAIRDGIPHFELVGLVRVVQARFSSFLTPRGVPEEDVDTYSPYTGEIVVARRADLEYGVTKCIAAEAVRNALRRNANRLLARGYDLSPLYQSPHD